MLSVIGKNIKLKYSEKKVDKLISSLEKKGLEPIFTSSKKRLLKKFGINVVSVSELKKYYIDLMHYFFDERSSVLSDVFMSKNYALLIRVGSGKGFLKIDAIAFSNNSEKSVKDVNKLFGHLNRFSNKKWDDSFSPNEKFLQEKNSTNVLPNPSKDDIEASEILQDENFRKILINVKRRRTLLLKDLLKSKNSVYVRKLKDSEKKGLVKFKYVTRCKKNDSIVNIVESKKDIEEMSKKGVQCSCGKPIAEENIEEVITLTEKCEKLLDGSKWMGYIVFDALTKIMIDPENVLLVKQNGDILDLFINHFGQLIPVELKDRELAVGDAWKFNSKAQKYNSRKGIVITTTKVAKEAKDFFKDIEGGDIVSRRRRRSGITISYVEGLKNLQRKLEKIFEIERELFVSRLLRRQSRESGINLEKLILKKFR